MPKPPVTAAEREASRQRFVAAQERLGLSNAQMGKALGRNRRMVIFYRRGKTPVSPPLWKKIEKLLADHAAS